MLFGRSFSWPPSSSADKKNRKKKDLTFDELAAKVD